MLSEGHVTACVGEWSGRERWRAAYIHWHPVASVLVAGQWRSSAGGWHWRSSHSTDEHSAAAGTSPCRRRLSSQDVVPNAPILQRTHSSAVRSTPQQQQQHVVVLRHLTVQSTMIYSQQLHWSTLWLSLFVTISCLTFELATTFAIYLHILQIHKFFILKVVHEALTAYFRL